MNKRNMRRDLDMTMANITLSPARRAEILQDIRPRRRHRPHWTVGRAVLAAVLAVLLTFSAFAAAIPALREALRNALGNFTEQSQPITGIVTEDNGIEVRPVAALSSSGVVRVWAEVQDKTGDRLSADMDVFAGFTGMLGNANQGLVGHEVVSYDEQTRTALIEVYQTGYAIEDGDQVTLAFYRFQPYVDISELGLDVPTDIITGQTLACQTSENDHIYLQPEQTPQDLNGNEYVRVSSFGFGTDGNLHLQFAFTGDANREHNVVLTTARSKSGKDIAKYNSSAPVVEFEQNGTHYIDIAYTIKPSELGDIIFDDLYGTLYTCPAAEGEWSAELTVELADEVVYYPNVQVGGALVEEIRVSEIGVFARSASKATILGHRPTYAMTKSGEKLYLTNNCIEGGWSIDDSNADSGAGHAQDQWVFDGPMDPSEIVLLNFDGVDVPLQ